MMETEEGENREEEESAEISNEDAASDPPSSPLPAFKDFFNEELYALMMQNGVAANREEEESAENPNEVTKFNHYSLSR